jgi:hypothetical protein
VQDKPARTTHDHDGWTPAKELRESLFLIALMISTMGAFVGLGAAAVRIFAAR